MNALDKKILGFIKKSGQRIKLNFLLSKVLVGLQASLILIFIILVIALFVPFRQCYEVCCFIIAVSFVVSVVLGFIKAPKKREIALITDSRGLGERVITALEFLGDESDIAKIQKEDTVRKLESYNFKRSLPIRISKRDIYNIIVLTILCLAIAEIPTGAKKEAINLRNFDTMKSDISKKIDKEEKKLDKENELTQAEKEELKKIFKETEKQLKDTNKDEEATKLMDRLDKKFDALKQEANSENEKKFIDDLKKNLIGEQKGEAAKESLKNLNELNNALSKSKLGKELMEALKSGDKEAINKKLKELKDSLKNSSDKDKNEFSNSLKDAAANLSDEDLKQLLEQSSDDVMDGEMDSSELADALASLNNSSNSQSGNEKSSESGQGSSSGNSGNGSGSGNSSGSGSGSGNGSGEGGNGGGWNTGSKDGQENSSKPSSGEQVFIPGRKVGNDQNLSGNKSDNGSSQSIETEKGINFNGEKKDYNSVVGDYSKDEINSMNNSSLPENLQGVVKNYFNNIK